MAKSQKSGGNSKYNLRDKFVVLMKILNFWYHKFRSILSDFVFAVSTVRKKAYSKISGIAGFHHVRLNVTDKDSAIAYYEKYFHAKKVKYQARTDALLTDKSYLLFNLVDDPPPTNLGSSLWHIGWSGVDAQHEFNWRVKEGINVHTPITPLDGDYWMYFWGPNNEIVEVYTAAQNHEFEHIHLLASDVDKTMNWFKSFLGLTAEYKRSKKDPRGYRWNYLYVDNIYILVVGKPLKDEIWWPKGGFKSTEGTAFNHIGFSFDNIELIFEQMRSAEAEIVHDIKTDPAYGLKSFFVRGPDQLLIEIVEKNPI